MYGYGFGYDPELPRGFQDADFEQRELEDSARRHRKAKPALPTVDELNAIQAEWMKLDPHAPKAETARVIKLMERLPKRYVSSSLPGLGVAIVDGTPMQSKPIELAYVINQVRTYGGRVDVMWNGTLGKWV